MGKPTKQPEWDITQVNSIEPTQERKDEGWLAPAGVPEKPPFQTFNYWQNEVYRWIKAINDQGVLDYDNITDYVANVSTVVGSDGVMYSCKINNGESSSVVGPVGDSTGTWVFSNSIGKAGELISLTYEPTATQKVQMQILEGDGSSVLDTDFPNIIAKWGGKIYGSVDGTHFNLPDLSGQFSRFWDNGAGVDPEAATRTDRGDGTTGDNVGTRQVDQFGSHDHNMRYRNGVGNDPSSYQTTDGLNDGDTNSANLNRGGLETRPVNIYVWGGIFY